MISYVLERSTCKYLLIDGIVQRDDKTTNFITTKCARKKN